MITISDAFEPFIGTKEYNGIVATIQKWYYGCNDFPRTPWCASSVSYFANEVGILDQIGGKNDNVCAMMRATEAANKSTGKGTFKRKTGLTRGTLIPKGSICFMLWEGTMRVDNPKKHVTTAAEPFVYSGSNTFRALGGNQKDSICIMDYQQEKIYAVFMPDYEDEPSYDHPTLRRGDKGASVKDLQAKLNRMCFRDAWGDTLKTDGSYGVRTESAVKCMQRDQGLVVDGICGPITWGRIDELLDLAHSVEVMTDLYIRKGPGSDYASKGVLREGEEHYLTREKDDWGYIPKVDGWAKVRTGNMVYLKPI